MMSILSRHIRDYIQAAGVVSFPEVGAIMLKEQQSKVHPVSHHFDPPHSYWHFNPFLAKKDRAFIDWLKSVARLDDAESAYDRYSSEIKSSLDAQQNYHWKQIGWLKAENGKWFFEAEQAIDPSSDFFGLPSFDSSAIIRNENKGQKPAERKVVPIKEEAKVSAEKENPNANEKKTDEDKPRKLRAAAWIAAASFLLIALLGILMLLDVSIKPLQADANKVNYMLKGWFDKGGEPEMEPILTADLTRVSLSPIKELKTTEEASEAVKESEPIESEAEVIEAPVATNTDNSPSKGFYLILGSFKDQSNAESLKETLLNEGVEARVFYSESKGFYRTGYFLTDDKDEAVDILYTAQTSNPDLWLLEKN